MDEIKIENLKMLRIYLKENDWHKGSHSYKFIIKKLKEYGISGATVFKGICGYGKRGIAEIDIIRLSMDLPVVIECIDDEEKINKLIPILHEIIGENGLITIVDVAVVKNKE
jgi:PII-like signaling protein